MYYTRTTGLTVCISVHPDREKNISIYHKATALLKKKKERERTKNQAVLAAQLKTK